MHSQPSFYYGANIVNDQQIERVRALCLALPATSERLSHGEPTFFIGKKVFVMFANNHHEDGHVAVWLPVPLGMQSQLIESKPEVYFRPPYVGTRGWLGIQLALIPDEELRFHVELAWELVAPKRILANRRGKDNGRKRKQAGHG